jgi:uncharacterized tellurite resistance protein B-like protein
MSLFDAFKSHTPKLTTQSALPVSLLFMMAADGHVDEEEIGQLKSVLGDDEALIKSAIQYMKAFSFEQFLADAKELLNPQQKLCILLNITDSLMSDGMADPAEQEMLAETMLAFGVSEDEFKPHFETILIKNTRSVV